VFATLWANSTFRHLLLTISVTYLFGYGLSLWQPTFFIRSYGLKTGELGTWLTLVFGLGSFLGTYWAANGRPVARPARSVDSSRLSRSSIVVWSDSAATYLSPNKYCAFALLGISTVGINIGTAPLYALIQTLVAERMRAVSVAIIYLFANLIGMGVGP